MVNAFLEEARKSTYDFRLNAHPGDPLRHLFPEWVSYYRLKWAIARVLQPKSILEIGVRFGYSARAFLDACPEASYLGIDNDSETFGGWKGAMEWAEGSLSAFRAELMHADSQQLTELPGDHWDLVHVDGQQDGSGSFHDLLLALPKARYILVDGFLWTRENLLASSEFLLQYRDLIKAAVLIPGYAGELLIEPWPNCERMGAPASSGDIRSAYTSHYYLSDCGGFDVFKRDQGRALEDIRLRSVAEVAETAPIGAALDLGCGRGELALHLARLGHRVTAIDYSTDAIALAQTALAQSPGLPVAFLCGDVNEAPWDGPFDVAVASDLIEHLTPAELDRLYARVAANLRPSGLFVVHTYPNLWFYKYEHRRRLRIARQIGAYLPADPRSRFERLMHINEQSPAVLKRSLLRHFPHVLLWFAGHDLTAPFENLRRRFTIQEMRSAGDLFAIASHQPIQSGQLMACLDMPALPDGVEGLSLRCLSSPDHVSPGATFELPVQIFNGTPFHIRSSPPHPVHLSYHWLAESGDMLHYNGDRTGLPHLLPGRGAEVKCRVRAPAMEGRLTLRLTRVQELIRRGPTSPVPRCASCRLEG